MEVILYSMGCPLCDVLMKKLSMKNVDFTECTDEEKMRSLGIETVPVLSVDGVLMGFKTAVEWINNK